MRLRAGLSVLALVVSALLAPSIGGTSAAGALSTSVAVSEGTLIPGLQQPWRFGQSISSASAEFLLHTVAQYDDGDFRRTFTLVRTSDGAVIRTLRAPDGPTANDPVLRGRWLVQTVEPDSDHREVQVRDAVTGDLVRSFDTWSRGVLVRAEPTWVMTSRSGTDTGLNTVTITRADGSTTEVRGNFGSPPRWYGAAGDIAYLSDVTTDYAVDLLTGDRTALAFPHGARLLHTTAGSVVGAARAPDGATTLTALSRDSLAEHWTVTVPADHRIRYFVPLGEGVAAVYLPDGAVSADDFSLRPVDLTTGRMQSAVAEHVLSSVPTGDGRLAVQVADTVSGRLALVGPGTTRALGDLPVVLDQVMSVGLSRGRVVVSWRGRSAVSATTLDGASGWTTLHPDADWGSSHRRGLRHAGGAVLTYPESGADQRGDRFRLMTSAGTRDLWASSADLSRGGRYLLRTSSDPAGPGTLSIEDLVTGVVVSRLPASPRPVVDGTRLWRAPDDAGIMRSTDLLGAEAPRAVEVPAVCRGAELLNVVGRWARLWCRGTAHVVDLTGAVPPRAGPGIGLGNGFALTVEPRASDPEGSPYATVTDLVSGESRTYGPLRGRVYPPGPGLAADDSGAADLVYVDPLYQVRHVDLDWLSAQGRADLTPPPTPAPDPVPSPTPVPTLVRIPSVEPVVPVGVASVMTWSFQGATTYDVRVREGAGPWSSPPTWTGLESGSIETRAPTGSRRCYAARGVGQGGPSDWSPEVCQRVDGSAPIMATVGRALTYATGLRGPIAGETSATDDDLVSSYDVETRSADPGRSLGAWRPVVSAGPVARWATSAQQLPGSQHCFRARARDRAGNTSGWTSQRCTVLPVDDRSGKRGRGAVRATSAPAIAGTVTRLERRGAQLVVPGQSGRVIGVWIQSGPRRGVLDVLADGRSVGRVATSASRARRDLVLVPVPRGFSGPVTLRSRSAAPVVVDAVSVAR